MTEKQYSVMYIKKTGAEGGKKKKSRYVVISPEGNSYGLSWVATLLLERKINSKNHMEKEVISSLHLNWKAVFDADWKSCELLASLMVMKSLRESWQGFIMYP